MICLVGCCAVGFCSCGGMRRTTRITEEGTHTSYVDLYYGDEERHRLDLYVPRESDGTLGVILMLHGGGWSSGCKEAFGDVPKEWCIEMGYAVAAIDYRYATEEGVDAEEMLDDITLALKKVREVLIWLGFEPGGAMLYGQSAGGHLAMLYAYTRCDEAPIKPRAVFTLAGPSDLTNPEYFDDNPLKSDILTMFESLSGLEIDGVEIEKAIPRLAEISPITYINSNTVPTVIAHGRLDEIVPYSGAETLASRLSEWGVEHKLITYESSGHGLDGDPDANDEAYALMWEYAERFL